MICVCFAARCGAYLECWEFIYSLRGGNRGGGGCSDDGLSNQLVDKVVKGGLMVWSTLGADGFILWAWRELMLNTQLVDGGCVL